MRWRIQESAVAGACTGESAVPISPGVAHCRKVGIDHNVLDAVIEALTVVDVELWDRPG